MARTPYHKPEAPSWSDDAATVIYGDDLLEDVQPTGTSHPPRAAGAGAVAPPGVAPPAVAPPAVAPPAVPVRSPSAPMTSPPHSGLDSLRPYVGKSPEIVPSADRAIEVTSHPEVERSGFRLGSFLWGVVATSALAGGLIFFVDLGPAEPQVATAPAVLDGDKIAPVSQTDLLTRAKKAEPGALKELEKKEPSELSADELLALSLGQQTRKQERVTKEITRLAKKTSLTHQDREDFFFAAGNERTYRQALLAMAHNKSYWGPDIIYEVTRRYRHQKDVTAFAMQVLLTPQVYKYASPALTVVIDAEVVSECSAVRELVERAHEDGDSRAVRHMAKFAERTGCGEQKLEDCYPCLRDDRALVDALRAAQGRMPPR